MMHIQVKLFASLVTFAPEGKLAGEAFTVTLPEGARVRDVLVALGIGENEVKVTFVNGRARAGYYKLQPGDVAGIFPPIGGG